ncbi:hypothetical protein CAEBREN_04030 [Caenorhabditis brenneri]|uniref:Uncharacterized protein n=1 Tax=Caenorhabditis brenneri TaxID=135651 RepID=G0NS95_CAEBE|nr:hypothetical protein CAEBREN_04030 [Caenorhabditis brenneri]
MAYSRYYGTQNQALGQQYNDDGSSQLFIGNLHQRRAQNQNDQVVDFWGESDQAHRQNQKHLQKFYDGNTANQLVQEASGEQPPKCSETNFHQSEDHSEQSVFEKRPIEGQQQNHPPMSVQQKLNSAPNTNNSSGFVQDSYAQQHQPASGELVGPSNPEGAYQALGSNRLVPQQPGQQQREHMMPHQFGGSNRPMDYQLQQAHQHNLQLVPDDCNRNVPKQPNEQCYNSAGTHNQQQYASGNDANLSPDGSAQGKLGYPEKPNYQNLDQLNPQQSLGNNDPFRIEHIVYDPPTIPDLEIGHPQQMKESIRTKQLTLQMERHNLLSPKPICPQNNNYMMQTPQQLTHQRFQEAQSVLLETDSQAETEEPVEQMEMGNNEGDDQWKPMEDPEIEDYVPQYVSVSGQHNQQIPEGENPEDHVSYNQQQYGNNSGFLFRQNQQNVVLHGSAHGVPGNNESDGRWMPMDTSDCNNQYPFPSTDSTISVNFLMDNNGVPLPPVRVQKPQAPRGSIIPKVSTSRKTSLENNKRRESALQFSPAAKPAREFVERKRTKENTIERENNRGYSKTYRENQKKLLKMAEKEKDEVLELVQELQKTTLKKEKNAKFALKLLKIMGRAPEKNEKDEEKRYEEKKQKKIKKFEDLKENDDDINEAKEAKSEAEENLKAVTVLVAAKQANASKKTRAKDHLKLKSHLYAKLIYEHDYKREIELQRLVHILLRHTCRPFLDPPLRYELEKKMQGHEILEKQLEDFIEFIDSHSSLFKPPTEQEDKIK